MCIYIFSLIQWKKKVRYNGWGISSYAFGFSWTENLSAQCMGYIGATLTQVFTRVRGADVSLRDVTIAQMGNGAWECGWRHAPEAHGAFWKIWKSQLVELRTRLGTRRVDFRGSQRPDEFARYWRRSRWWRGSRWKSHHRKIVHLSSLCRNL